jgi:hypothetical protein
MDSLPKVNAGLRLNPDRSNFSIPSSSAVQPSPKASDTSPKYFQFTSRHTQQNVFLSSFSPLKYDKPSVQRAMTKLCPAARYFDQDSFEVIQQVMRELGDAEKMH